MTTCRQCFTCLAWSLLTVIIGYNYFLIFMKLNSPMWVRAAILWGVFNLIVMVKHALGIMVFWANFCYLFLSKYRVSLKKGWGICTGCWDIFTLRIYIYIHLFDTHSKYHTILYHPGRYSFLTDKKWAYDGNLEINHHKCQHFMFLNIFLQFVCLFRCFVSGLAVSMQVWKNDIL